MTPASGQHTSEHTSSPDTVPNVDAVSAREKLSKSDAARERLPVVVLGTGITALGVIRVLARDGFQPFVTDDADLLVRRSRWFRPLPGGVRSTPNLADWLPRLPFARAVLIPCSDSWVRQIATMEESLRRRYPSSVPAPDVLELFVDKGRFADLLRRSGTPHPFTRIVDEPADLATVPSAVFSSAILKPRDSQRFMQRFGVKAWHVDSAPHAAEQMLRLRDEGFPVVLQEYIPGPPTQHYFVDGFVDRTGVVRGIFVRQRLRMYPADFGNSTFMISVAREAAAPAVASITSLLRSVGYRGIFSAEFKLDPRDGQFKILEVNARAWWYIEFAARCGVDVCRMAYDDALDQPVTGVDRYEVGRRLVYPYFDFHACANLVKRGETTFWDCARSWIGAIQPLHQLADPAPGLRFVGRTVTTFFVSRARKVAAVAWGFILSLFTGA